jgi:RHS repeat-associated protein
VNLTFLQQAGDTSAITDGGDQYTGLDRFGRVIDQNWLNASTGTSTDRFQMGYDQNSDVLYRQNLVNAAFSELYGYDSLLQLTSFQRGTLNLSHTGLVGSASRSQSWTPDALGNFSSVTTNGTAQTRTANQQNEITSISGAGTVSFDANGNLTADGSGNDVVYDAWNRLVAVKNGTTTLAAYSYDGLSRRMTETHGSTTTALYYSDQWQVLEERVGGVVQARNVWSEVYVDALVLRDQSSAGNGVLDQRLYVQQDANWNVTALIDTSGNVVERYVYDPYGAVTVLTPTWSARSASLYNWLYLHQGGRVDPATGLYNFRERDYSPTLLRWLQNDPLAFAGGSNNLYQAENNRPTVEIDPTGLVAPPAQLPKGAFTFYCDEHSVGYTAVYQDPAKGLEFGLYCTGKQFIGIVRKIGAKTGKSFGKCVYYGGRNVQFFEVKQGGLSVITWFNFQMKNITEWSLIEAHWETLLKANAPDVAAEKMMNWLSDPGAKGGAQYLKQEGNEFNMRMYVWNVVSEIVEEYGLRSAGTRCDWYQILPRPKAVDVTLPGKDRNTK